MLEPFLDRDLLHPRETDYLMTCSVFAPLQDALTCGKLKREEVDFCLLVGGSVLIPQISEAVDRYLNEATMLRFDDKESMQTAVAQGAAWQALSLAVSGHGLVSPVTADSISIQTANGPVELIGKGAELPYPPGGGWAESERLVIPDTNLVDGLKLRVEVCGSEGRVLMSAIWPIRSIVNKGDPIRLQYKMDANQVLDLRLSRAGGDDVAPEFNLTVENDKIACASPRLCDNSGV